VVELGRKRETEWIVLSEWRGQCKADGEDPDHMMETGTARLFLAALDAVKE
jgi:hypothetical protein